MTKKRLKIGVKLALCSSVLLTGIVSCGQSNVNDNSDYYSLKLNYNDDKSRPLVLDVQKGQSVQTPTDPIRTGYSFAGWFTEKVGGSEITFPYLLTKDDVIYAHWEAAKYNVSFDLNYENATIPYTSSVDYLSSVDALENNPTRDGFVFRYWSTTPDGNNPVTFPYTIKKDTTFYASWRDADVLVHKVTVVYGDYDGAPTSFTLEIEDGKQVTSSLLPSATRSGFGFDGWSLSQDGSQKVTLPYTPTGSCTLYAIWKAQAYKLSLRYNYVDAPETFYDQISFGAGDSIDEPTAPTRAGYQFEGWYTTALGGTKIVFPVSLKKSAVYFAHWKSNPVVTDVFDAEYVEFEPNTKYPGYSGEATGNGVIIPNDVSGVRVDNYPVNSARTSGKGYYVSFQYMLGAQIIYNIEASEDLNNVKLYANWAVEIADGGLTFGPTGPNAYEVSVNGSPINYTPAVVGGPNEGAGQYKSGFKEYLLASNISLRKGTNTIILEPKNENGAVMGGTIKSVAPMTDYIRFDYGSTGKLSWSPVYDNLDGK